MGTDINLWAEYKDKDGKWIVAEEYEPKDDRCYMIKYSDRCYEVFTILGPSGRRPNIKSISEYRGMPKDYKKLEGYKDYLESRARNFGGYTYEYYKDERFNAESYHTLTQLKEYDWDSLEKEVNWIKEETFYDELIPALQRLADKHGGDENVRIVFFFDN